MMQSQAQQVLMQPMQQAVQGQAQVVNTVQSPVMQPVQQYVTMQAPTMMQTQAQQVLMQPMQQAVQGQQVQVQTASQLMQIAPGQQPFNPTEEQQVTTAQVAVPGQQA